MTPEAMAALHVRCFDVAPRPWSQAEFATLLADPTTISVSEAQGFALGRYSADEAEFLTIAVAPEARRRGIAARLETAFAEEAAWRGAKTLFLEVAADNAAALALYRRAGYRQVGIRRKYYNQGTGSTVDALVLSRLLLARAGKTI